MTGYKNGIPVWAKITFVISFCLAFYFIIISPSFTELGSGSPTVVDIPPTIYTPPVPHSQTVINQPLQRPTPVEPMAENSNGIFKCVNDGKVSYTQIPCKSGNMPIRDLVSTFDAPSNS